MTKRINVTTVAQAVTTEEWWLEVPDDYVLPAGEEDGRLLDLLAGEDERVTAVFVCETVSHETDRQVQGYDVLVAVTVKP